MARDQGGARLRHAVRALGFPEGGDGVFVSPGRNLQKRSLFGRNCEQQRPWPLERAVLRSRGMVRLSIALHTTSSRSAQELHDALRFLVVRTQFEPGCQTCSAWTTPDAVRYIEEWITEADMRRRVRSDAFTSLLAIVESAKEAHVQFDFVTRTRGLDYVVEMRNDLVT